jgi:hypothetical protein
MNAELGTWPMSSNGIGERGVVIAKQLCGVGEVVVSALFPFPYLDLFNSGVTSIAVRMPDESRFEEPDEVGFVCGW